VEHFSRPTLPYRDVNFPHTRTYAPLTSCPITLVAVQSCSDCLLVSPVLIVFQQQKIMSFSFLIHPYFTDAPQVAEDFFLAKGFHVIRSSGVKRFRGCSFRLICDLKYYQKICRDRRIILIKLIVSDLMSLMHCTAHAHTTLHLFPPRTSKADDSFHQRPSVCAECVCTKPE